MSLEIVEVGESYNLIQNRVVYYAQVILNGDIETMFPVELVESSYKDICTILRSISNSQSTSPKPLPKKTVVIPDNEEVEDADQEEWIDQGYKGPFEGVGFTSSGDVILSGLGHIPS